MNRTHAEKKLAIGFLAAVLILPACQSMNKHASGQVVSAATTAGARATQRPAPIEDIAQQVHLSRVASVYMLNPETGWLWGAAGHSLKLFRTNDGGRHWQPDLADGNIPLSLGVDYFYTAKLFIQDPQNMTINWTDEKGLHVLHSRDEGAKWQEAVIPDQDMAQDIEFADESHGWILTTGMDAAMGHTQKKVYKTSDGGKTWTIVSSDTGYIPVKNATKDALPQYGSATGMTFTDAVHGWVTLENWTEAGVRLFHTADSGHTWKQKKLSTPAGIDAKSSYSIPQAPRFFGSDKRQGMMIAAYKDGTRLRYAKYETKDGGATWSSLVMLAGADAEIDRQEITFTTIKRGWFVFHNQLWMTEDGGHHWSPLPNDDTVQRTLQRFPIIFGLQFTDSESGWLLCKSDQADQWALLNTRDGGINWTRV